MVTQHVFFIAFCRLKILHFETLLLNRIQAHVRGNLSGKTVSPSPLVSSAQTCPRQCCGDCFLCSQEVCERGILLSYWVLQKKILLFKTVPASMGIIDEILPCLMKASAPLSPVASGFALSALGSLQAGWLHNLTPNV